MSICESCSRLISGTSRDPIVSAKSLGWKNYHYACAKSAWEKDEMPKISKAVSSDLSDKASHKTKFYVQCVLIEDGSPATRWHNIVDSLEEAEDYCKKQMEPSDPGFTGALGFVCNVSPNKYVNCSISLLLKDGKQTQIDELLHPMSINECIHS